MKTCRAADCDFPVFSHEYCKRHQYMRTDKKMANKERNKRSAARLDKERIYHSICEEIDREALQMKNRKCVFCGKTISDSAWADRHHHHQFGRIGKLLTDKQWIKLAHGTCHLDYHNKSVSLLWWWADYMERIKDCEKLYNKELKREEKEKCYGGDR